MHFTTGPGDATAIARDLAKRAVDTVVVAGGDGTVNETVNGLVADDRTVSPDTRMAIIPCGTGRDLGRSFGMKNIDYAIRSLELNAWTTIDIGKASFHEMDTGYPVSRYFINVGDVGIGAETANRINNTSKRFGGFTSYLYGALASIADFQPQELRLDLDGEQVFEGAANMVLFANGRFHAGGMLVAPEASFHDGMLDIFILEDVGKLKMVTSLLPRVYLGKHVGQTGIQHFKGKVLRVSSPDRLRIEMDGEQPGVVPAEIRIVANCLKVFGAGAMLR